MRRTTDRNSLAVASDSWSTWIWLLELSWRRGFSYEDCPSPSASFYSLSFKRWSTPSIVLHGPWMWYHLQSLQYSQQDDQDFLQSCVPWNVLISGMLKPRMKCLGAWSNPLRSFQELFHSDHQDPSLIELSPCPCWSYFIYPSTLHLPFWELQTWAAGSRVEIHLKGWAAFWG